MFLIQQNLDLNHSPTHLRSVKEAYYISGLRNSASIIGLGWHTHPNKKEEDKELKALKASLPCCRMSVRGQPRVPLSCVRTTYNPTHPWPKSFNLSPGSLNIEQPMHDPSSYSRLINTNSAIRTAARRKTELRTH